MPGRRFYFHDILAQVQGKRNIRMPPMMDRHAVSTLGAQNPATDFVPLSQITAVDSVSQGVLVLAANERIIRGSLL